MAKISKIEFILDGKRYSEDIICNSKGEFRVGLPRIIVQKLQVHLWVDGYSLEEVKRKFNDVLEKYRNALTTKELLIAIRYASGGMYSYKKDGGTLFNHNASIFNFESRGSDRLYDKLGFTFEVVIKETVDTVVKYHKATKGKDLKGMFDDIVKYEPEVYYEDGGCDIDKKWKLIPFNEESLKTLEVVAEQIRKASEFLFNFINQDEKVISDSLASGTMKTLLLS